MKALLERIDEMPGDDGWWKSSTGDVFRKAAKKLSKLGMPDDEIVDFLEGIRGAVAEEYGD